MQGRLNIAPHSLLSVYEPSRLPSVGHSSRILAEAGWRVLFVGTGALGANALSFQPHPRIEVRKMAFCRPGWRQKLHYLAYCFWVLWVTVTWRPSWIYASDPLASPVALLLGLIPGLRLLYHEHDSPKRSATRAPFEVLVRWTRRSIARRAEVCVLPNATRLSRFQAELGPVRSAACVWNCPGIHEAEALPRPAMPTATPIRVLYHGSIVPERLSPAALDALTLLDDRVKLRVIGYETAGSRGYIDE